MKQLVQQAVRTCAYGPFKMGDEEILFATGYLKLKRRIRKKKEREAWKRRKMWVWEIYKQRNEYGIHHNLVLEMALGDREIYFK